MKLTNINLKKIGSLALTGVMTFTGTPKIAKANDNKQLTREEIIKMCESSVQKQLSYEEFCLLSYNVCEYMKPFGLDVSIDELYSMVYIANYAYINEDIKMKLVENNFIQDYDTTINKFLSICALISTYNGNIYSKALEERKIVDRSKIIKVSEFSINERDQYISNTFDSRLADYIDTGKTDCNIYTDLYNGYVKIPTYTNYKMEQASIGFEKVINLTSGANFYSQITKLHDTGISIVASEQDLRILSEHIHDIGNVEVALKNKVLIKK